MTWEQWMPVICAAICGAIIYRTMRNIEAFVCRQRKLIDELFETCDRLTLERDEARRQLAEQRTEVG